MCMSVSREWPRTWSKPFTTDERNDPAKLTQNHSEVTEKVVENA